MKLIPLVVGLLAASSSDALKVRAGMWGPADLELVDTALQHILSLHMTPAMHTRAQVVAADVKSDIAAIALARNLTKQERQAKVGAAIKELVEFQGEMEKETDDLVKEQKQANMKGKIVQLGNELDPEIEKKYQEKKAHMLEELKEKKAELDQDEKMMQLLKLKKELAEKELELNNLELQKAKDASSKKDDVKDAKAQQEMVKNLLTIANGLKVTKPGAKVQLPPQINAILVDLRKRSDSLKAGLATLDSTQKKSEADLDAALQKQVGVANLGKTDAMSKAQAMIKSLKKKEERKFQKLRAVKKSELTDIDTAIASIEKGDVGALQTVLTKMQEETKAVDAKSGHFLY